MKTNLTVQLQLSTERVAELERLMAQTGVATRKDFFENALILLEWAIRERIEKRIIASVSVKDGDYREIIMPALASMKYEEDSGNRDSSNQTNSP